MKQSVGAAFVLLLFLSTVSFHAQMNGDWPSVGRDPGGQRFSPLTQINAGNVSRLEVAWRFHTGEGAPEFSTSAPTALEVTPLVFRGTMYLSTPIGRVFALDPVTGKRIAADSPMSITMSSGSASTN